MFINNKKNKKKVIVSMSGGVDSSVSAWLLQQQGYEVEGMFMKNWEEDDNKEYCSAARDLEDAQSVCNTLGIYLHTINFSYEYWNNVFIPFLSEYKSGRTPNPDILCNKKIKFESFLKFSLNNLRADFIATGHYVRRIDIDGKSYLFRGLDKNKDQSYFLYMLNHIQLSNCLFPIGKLIKKEVRCIAEKLKLVTALKKDSTGICFIGKKKFSSFIKNYLPEKPGIIMSVDGKKIGYHKGLMYYTLGQRKGIFIGGIKNSNNTPWYVVDKDIKNNILIVAQNNKHPRLMSTNIVVYKLNWIDKKPLLKKLNCTVKTRYRQSDISCLVTPQSNKYVNITFYHPVAAVTPGQSVVFYLEEKCLGGGIILSRNFLNY